MNMLQRRIILLLATIAISFLTASCGESKVSQCQKIIEVVNKAASEAQATGKSNNPDKIAELEKASVKFDQYATELEAVKVKDETLQTLQARFIKMYREISKAGQELVQAARKKDVPEINTSVKALQDASNQEGALVNEFNQYCGGKKPQ